MKSRMRWFYQIIWNDGSVWNGDCPAWFAVYVPGATKKKYRVRFLGPQVKCSYCHGKH